MEPTKAEEAWGTYAAEWQPATKQLSNGTWEARLEFRDLVTQGSTEKEAIGGLIHLYCELSRDGSLNPEHPRKPGAPPLQHVIQVLDGHLQRHVHLRYSDWREIAGSDEAMQKAHDEGNTAGSQFVSDPRFTRRNEIVSGLATAIAALARVKEL